MEPQLRGTLCLHSKRRHRGILGSRPPCSDLDKVSCIFVLGLFISLFESRARVGVALRLLQHVGEGVKQEWMGVKHDWTCKQRKKILSLSRRQTAQEISVRYSCEGLFCKKCLFYALRGMSVPTPVSSVFVSLCLFSVRGVQ